MNYGQKLLDQGWTIARHRDGREVPLADIAPHVTAAVTIRAGAALRLACDDDPQWTESRPPTSEEVAAGANVRSHGRRGPHVGTWQVWLLPVELHPDYSGRQTVIDQAWSHQPDLPDRCSYETAARTLGMEPITDADLSSYSYTYMTADPAQDPSGRRTAQQIISARRRDRLRERSLLAEFGTTSPVSISTGSTPDRQATTVAELIGLAPPEPTGRCHYCGLPLPPNGSCDECV
jgi:hypothetical protein